MSNDAKRIAIVGGGIEGSSIAFHLCRQDGVSVTIFDPNPLSGASQVAAGMLAPVAEAVYGEERLLDLMLASAEYWKTLSEELLSEFDIDVAYRSGGSLLVGVTPNDMAEIERTYKYYQGLGLGCELVRPSDMRQIEHTLSPALSLGIYTEIDNQVDNRRAHKGLLSASEQRGTQVINQTVIEISHAGNGVGILLEDGTRRYSDTVIVAAGVRSFEIKGTPAFLRDTMRPVRGQVLRLRSTTHGESPKVVLRTIFDSRPSYIVPRHNGEVIVGASSEEFGFETITRARSTFELLRDSLRVVPQLGEMDIAEINVGFRPATIDNFPILGFAEENLIIATGHFRHGILLASSTGKIIADLALTGALPKDLERFSPLRFNSN